MKPTYFGEMGRTVEELDAWKTVAPELPCFIDLSKVGRKESALLLAPEGKLADTVVDELLGRARNDGRDGKLGEGEGR